MENLEQLKGLLNIPKYIVITAHRNPDGDAIGSCLGLYHFLSRNGHTVRVVLPSEYPANFGWMKDVEQVFIYDLQPDKSKEVFEKADMVFCLDFNSLDRIDKLGEYLMEMKKTTTVLIDHHIDPEPFADFVLSDTSASSTSELIYDFIHLLGKGKEIDPVIGDCLYTGIVTDTGSFKYSTSPKLFRIVAQLLEIGVDDYALQELIFNCLPEKQLRLLGHCLANRMEILEEFGTGIITLTRKDYERFNIQRGDTEGIVNFLLKMKKVKVAAFITEQPNIVKLSLRSKGAFSVQEIASAHFKGGGHRNAAGGYSYLGLRKTVAKFKEILPSFKDKLAVS
jgi:phosphoesterase RecJ-like protein